MAKDVASRVPADDASAPEARERIERAAAQFASIHDRWSGLSADTSARNTHSSAGGLGDGAAPHEGEAEDSGPGPVGVRVTPILGVSRSEDAEPSARPRFKTLMGVPRSSPDIDVLAGLDVDPRRRHDTIRLERPATLPAAPLRSAPRAEEGAPAKSDEPSLAATSWPWERSAPAPRQAQSAAPSQRAALVESSLDVSAEVAALRTPNGRRYWWAAGLGTVAAVVALFAVGAPRERTLALHWLRQEYQVRVHPSVEAISDRARALRPTASVVAPAGIAESQHVAPLPAPATATGADAVAVGSSSVATPLEPALPPAAAVATDPSTAALVAATARSGAEATVPTDLASARELGSIKASAARAATDRRRPPAAGSARSRAVSPSNAAPSRSPVAGDVRNAPSHAAANNAAAAPGAARTTAGNASTSRQQVAAPRKRSQRPSALAANATKPRATRQNSPRTDAGGGIIRETPF